MGSRRPPTSDEVLGYLAENADFHTHCLVYDYAVSYLKSCLRTTPARARLWLANALTTHTDKIKMFWTVRGDITVVAEVNPDATDPEQQYRATPLEACGIPWPTGAQPRVAIDRHGSYLPRDSPFRPRNATPCPWIASTTVLHDFGTRALEEYADDNLVRDLTTLTRRAAAEERHGEALNHLRGLLHRLGVPDDESATALRCTLSTSHPDLDILTITLTTAETITRLGHTLRDLGIQPRPAP